MNTIFTGIPLGHRVGSLVNGNTVINMANAQVIDSTGLKLKDLNNRVFTGYIAKNGDYIKILEIFEGMLLVLVSHDENAQDWFIGYFEIETLVSKIMIRKNTITWNNNLSKTVFDANKNIIFQLPATQIIQFLYETPNNNFACILFNDTCGNLCTGYVPMNDGIFLRYPTLPNSPYPTKPSIKESISEVSNNSKFYSQEGNILKVGDLTLNLSTLNTLSTNNEFIYSTGFSSTLVEFIKLREGFSSTAYLDSTGHLTIGYGHLITGQDGFNASSTITQSQAENLLVEELSSLCTNLKTLINKNFPNFNFASTNQLDAVLDLAYNNGLIIASNQLCHSIFRDTITLNVNNLQFDFCEWCHGQINGQERPIFGLYKRKLEDFIIFTTGIYVNLPGSNIEQLQSSLQFTSNFSQNIWY